MTSTTASRVIPGSATAVFDHLTTLPLHESLIPFTRITARPGPAEVGDTIVAVTGRRLRDVMLVTRADPPDGAPHPCPGVAVFEKVGPVLLGSATIQVSPLGPRTCRVDWTEDVHLARPLRLLHPLLAPALHLMTARALRLAEDAVGRRTR
ncbi:SRPBCC family protein [Ruania rhizosphaerae]|uniref:SRPBCC family protein n=1 Tax=Ruania rhizosphaerae TaxID=1840413 RepID=UPI0013590C2C|nr:SRPBCC family protein [Ruania rhizosphaerae]